MTSEKLHGAVVLGIRCGGYGIVRSLSPLGIPIVAFEKRRLISAPECHTRLCDVRPYDNEADLLSRLLALAHEQAAAPVIYLTTDEGVEFFANHHDSLAPHFLIHFPASPDIATRLLHKDRFAGLASDHGFTVPRTLIIEGRSTVERVLRDVCFPCVLKPYKRGEGWRRAGFGKVLHFSSANDLEEALERVLSVEERLVVQEWVPGPDHSIFYSFVYYDSEKHCLADLPVRKLHQYPPLTGIGSVVEPVSDAWATLGEHVRSETRRLFDAIGYVGFGSAEFKQHAVTGEFYLIEVTACRVDQNSYITTANGINMPAIAYASLTGSAWNPGDGRRPRPILWVDEELEIRYLISLLRKPSFTALREIVALCFRPKAFRYLNTRDWMPFLHFLMRTGSRCLSGIFRRKRALVLTDD